MTARVYLETSVVSYLTARPSRDLVVAGHQQVTEDWWRTRKGDFELLVSPLVIQEAGRGDPEAVSRRMALLFDVPVLELTDSAQRLGLEIVAEHLERRGFNMPFVCTPEELLGGPREH